ncbi:MAG: hypothetical protein AAGH81_14000 [Bacteroidota bacterium]
MKETGLKRIQLFEFSDFVWLPNPIRCGLTNLLMVLHKLFGTTAVMVDLIHYTRQKIHFSQITDLGSGSGGPMIEVIEEINKSKEGSIPISLLLTDKYPNKKTVTHVNSLGRTNISYYSKSVDAPKLHEAPEGLKTMIASFHHMPPGIARQILSSAETNREPLLIYEIGENNVPTLLWWLLLPISLSILVIMALVMTPFVKPLTASQLLFTYIIPVIPLIYAWDGQASVKRTYTFEDVQKLLGDSKTQDYKWEIAKAKKSNGKNAGYHILGYPTST